MKSRLWAYGLLPIIGSTRPIADDGETSELEIRPKNRSPDEGEILL